MYFVIVMAVRSQYFTDVLKRGKFTVCVSILVGSQSTLGLVVRIDTQQGSELAFLTYANVMQGETLVLLL